MERRCSTGERLGRCAPESVRQTAGAQASGWARGGDRPRTRRPGDEDQRIGALRCELAHHWLSDESFSTETGDVNALWTRKLANRAEVDNRLGADGICRQWVSLRSPDFSPHPHVEKFSSPQMCGAQKRPLPMSHSHVEFLWAVKPAGERNRTCAMCYKGCRCGKAVSTICRRRGFVAAQPARAPKGRHR